MLAATSQDVKNGRIALVTGGAGFIGSTLVDHLLAQGLRVRVVDSFEDWYSPEVKRRNLAEALENSRFELIEADLASVEVGPLLRDVDVVYHLAGQPGVQSSWDQGFVAHAEKNILATQRLLDAATAADIGRVVIASSSSVYGHGSGDGPSHEDDPAVPSSPYAVSKYSAEQLADVYRNLGLDVVTLRYFTVYGPRQRPDMAMHKMVEAAIHATSFPVFGTGLQRRSFTFVGDVVDATARAGTAPAAKNQTINVGGGNAVSLLDVIEMVEICSEGEITIERKPGKPGDPKLTLPSLERARHLLGWEPTTELAAGLAQQVEWHLRQGVRLAVPA